METLKLAIADDNKELVRTMETYFERHPEIEIIWTAHNGKVCLSMLEEKVPDVLLLDIIMPHLDGIAVLETLRENPDTHEFTHYYAHGVWTRRCYDASSQSRRILFYAETI